MNIRWTALPILALALCLVSGLYHPSYGASAQTKVPTNLELVKSIRNAWSGVACTAQMAVQVGGLAEPILSSPLAISYHKDALRWVAFVTPPAPCSGTVVLGRLPVGLGNRPVLQIGTPPGIVVGKNKPMLAWKTIDRKSSDATTIGPSSLCGTNMMESEDGAGMFAGFVGSFRHRPDLRTWDTEKHDLLRIEGDLKGEDPKQQGRYMVWLDKTRGFLPVRSKRMPEQGALVETRYELTEVSKGHWLPSRWEMSGVGRATIVGEFRQLRCDRNLPESWFDAESYPDVESQTPMINKIREK